MIWPFKNLTTISDMTPLTTHAHSRLMDVCLLLCRDFITALCILIGRSMSSHTLPHPHLPRAGTNPQPVRRLGSTSGPSRDSQLHCAPNSCDVPSAHGQRRPLDSGTPSPSIHILDDDTLLNIFHLYRPFSQSKSNWMIHGSYKGPIKLA